MKTAKSYTKKELGERLVDFAMSKIDAWAEDELAIMRRASVYPIFVQMDKYNWILADYEICHLDKHKWRVTKDDKVIHIFYSQQAAVFYAVFTKFKYYKAADDILLKDQTVAKLSDEYELYTKKIYKKSKKTDIFQRDLWLIKLSDSKSRLATAREELEKRLKSAKYIKLWNQIL